MNEFRLLHSFQYKQYHSLSLDATVAIDGPGAIDAATEVLQQAYGEALLKMFDRYKENMQDKELVEYLKTVLPPEVTVSTFTNPILMDSLLMAAKKRRETK